ncbi:hypothetical protein ACVIWU_000807 [Bradyrhizobium sp. USDA 4509]
MPENDGSDQLETDQVFIDTQAYHRERYDWQSKSCNRLKELVRSGQLQVLTTSITRSEARSKIRESLVNARAALKKHDVVLGQLENAKAVAALDAAEAEARLQSLFDTFMREVRVIEVPLSKNVDKIFDDYFHERPPFSAKKKSEFPDAFVVSSLQERAQKTGKKIYVVSGDPDLKACCAHVPELIIVEGLSDIISKATVAKSVHDSLLSVLKNSRELHASLTECMMNASVTVRGGSRYFARSSVKLHVTSAHVASVDAINLGDLAVISQSGNKFTCLLDFETYADVWLEMQVEFNLWDGEEQHESSDEFSDGVEHVGLYMAELEVQFDAKSPETASLLKVNCHAEIEIDASQIDEIQRYFR